MIGGNGQRTMAGKGNGRKGQRTIARKGRG